MLFDIGQAQKRNSDISTSTMRLWPYMMIVLGLAGLLCSCATTRHYGQLQSSQDVTQLFEKAQVLSDHTYYYSGLQGVPDAIIAIHPSYTLRARLWQQVDFSHLTLKKWIFRMYYVQLVRPEGAWILGPDGNRLGLWFSAQRKTTIRLDRENRLLVAPPPPPELKGVP
ncbi:MAG: hypothetical protein JRE88_14960 [Deltaproteobacteria bacterium]|jgi:hypothetical protein|nr:hypothetical protein [Deltaproteobacteria bacterium]